MSYAAHEQLVAPARPSAALWRLVAGIVLLSAAFLTANQLYFSAVAAVFAAASPAALATEIAAGSTPRGMLILLFGFAAMILALWVTLGLMHARGLRSVIGPLPLAARQFARVALVLAALQLLLWLIPAPDGLAPRRNPNLTLAAWVALLPLALVALMVQVGGEELLFRGYLQSQLAARFASPLAWMVAPSLLFGLLHYDPSNAGANAVVIALLAAAFGFAAADLTARAGTLGPALALHAAVNAGALLLAAPLDQFNGLALMLYPYGVADTEALSAWAPLDLGLTACAWLAARWSLRL